MRGIVACGEIDGAGELTTQDFVGHRRRRRKGVRLEHTDSVLLQNFHRQTGEFFGVESRVAGHENNRIFGATLHVVGNCGNRQPHVGEGKIVCD